MEGSPVTDVPLDEVSDKLSDLIGAARDLSYDITITDPTGEPAAVVVGAYKYESMKATLEILGDTEMVKMLAAAEKENVVGIEEVATAFRAVRGPVVGNMPSAARATDLSNVMTTREDLPTPESSPFQAWIPEQVTPPAASAGQGVYHVGTPEVIPGHWQPILPDPRSPRDLYLELRAQQEQLRHEIQARQDAVDLAAQSAAAERDAQWEAHLRRIEGGHTTGEILRSADDHTVGDVRTGRTLPVPGEAEAVLLADENPVPWGVPSHRRPRGDSVPPPRPRRVGRTLAAAVAAQGEWNSDTEEYPAPRPAEGR